MRMLRSMFRVNMMWILGNEKNTSICNGKKERLVARAKSQNE
jgi:hypothetical protein